MTFQIVLFSRLYLSVSFAPKKKEPQDENDDIMDRLENIVGSSMTL